MGVCTLSTTKTEQHSGKILGHKGKSNDVTSFHHLDCDFRFLTIYYKPSTGISGSFCIPKRQ